jgi:hypothetical protein
MNFETSVLYLHIFLGVFRLRVFKIACKLLDFPPFHVQQRLKCEQLYRFEERILDKADVHRLLKNHNTFSDVKKN